MSLPDYLLEPDDPDLCRQCGECAAEKRGLCWLCLCDLQDMKADEAFERMIERHEI